MNERHSKKASPVQIQSNPVEWLLVAWCAALPFVWLWAGRRMETTGDRLTAADVLGVAYLFGAIALRGSFTPNPYFPKTIFLLAGSALLSTVVAVFGTSDQTSLLLSMLPWGIFIFLLLIAWAASSQPANPRLLSRIGVGLALGGLLESVIVYHDWFSSVFGGSVWFFDTLEMRVRGTFRASGQLAQYGLVVGGVLLALASWPMRLPRSRRLLLSVAGVLIMLFPLAAVRRSGIGALLAFFATWLALAVTLGRRGSGRKLLILAVPTLVLAMLSASASYGSFVAGRVGSAAESFRNPESFIRSQFDDALRAFSEAPLLGVGWGNNRWFTSTGHELHSAYLAVLVDAGVVGAAFLLAFLGTVAGNLRLLLRRANPEARESAIRLIALFVAQLVFWVHNRGLRDRGFFLFLFVVALLTQSVSRARPAPLTLQSDRR